MKKTIALFTLLFIVISSSFAQFEGAKQIYEKPDLGSIVSSHKKVAILPFEVKISYRKQPKNFNAEGVKRDEIAKSKSIQSSMYTFLLRKGENYTVEFQDVDKTNTLLTKAKMIDSLKNFTKDEIAKVLGVDAVLGGRFETEQTASEAGAVAMTVLFGAMGSKTGTGTMFLTLNNGSDGELLWRFFKSMDDSLFSSTDVLVERMMRKVSRNFPYQKNN